MNPHEEGNHLILIADAGSTKTDWCLLSVVDGTVSEYRTAGLNAASADDSALAIYIAGIGAQVTIAPRQIHYYGAGCATPAICDRVSQAFARKWPYAETTVDSDMLGAARALFGDKPGIACILGTGSNSCLYNGNEITDNVPALGYILGDEGSGSVLGRTLVSDIFKRVAPAHIRDAFLEKTGLDLHSLIDSVYRRPGANSFLASFVPFIADNIDDPYIESLVTGAFSSFFTRNAGRYCRTDGLPVGFIGSIAKIFEKQLREVAAEYGFGIAKITARPMEGLIEHHLKMNRK